LFTRRPTCSSVVNAASGRSVVRLKLDDRYA
jgi:hypothetical protein